MSKSGWFIIGAGLTLFVFLLVTKNASAWEEHYCKRLCLTPTTQPSVTPYPTEEVASPSATLEPSPTATQSSTPAGDNKSDGRSDGQSDGRHTAPDGLGCAVHECKAVDTNGNPYQLDDNAGWK